MTFFSMTAISQELADTTESAKGKIQPFEVCLLSVNPPAALASLHFLFFFGPFRDTE